MKEYIRAMNQQMPAQKTQENPKKASIKVLLQVTHPAFAFTKDINHVKLPKTNIMDSTATAKDFINKYFPDCDGAMMMPAEGDDMSPIEIIVFYHNINIHYHKNFTFRGNSIDVKVYRTSNCSFLATENTPQAEEIVRLLSQGTIIKDYNHEVETILAEAQSMHNKEVGKNPSIYKRIEANFFSLVCL